MNQFDLKRVFGALALLVALTGWARQAPITFYLSKPADSNARAQTDFKAGDTLYAVVQFDKPLGELLERKSVPVRIEAGEDAFVAVTLLVTDQNRNDTSARFYFMGPGQEERTMRMLAGFLSERSTGVLPLTIAMGPHREAQGKITIDMSAGKKAFDKLIADAGKSLAEANADAALPKAARTDPKLEADVVAMLKTENPHIKVHKVILTKADWNLERDPSKGGITGRSTWAALLSEDTRNGSIWHEPLIIIRQAAEGGGKFGKLSQGGGTAGDEPIPVPCSRFQKK